MGLAIFFIVERSIEDLWNIILCLQDVEIDQVYKHTLYYLDDSRDCHRYHRVNCEETQILQPAPCELDQDNAIIG